MGLSASQTRFLTLTARKSNVEYQGQQINQARTALANQSSQLYTQMMNLKAPTAPSVYEYVINPATKPALDWENPSAYPMNDADAKNFCIYYAGNAPSFKNFNIPEYEVSQVNGVDVYSKVSYDENGKKQLTQIAGTPTGTYCTLTTGKDEAGNERSFMQVHVAEDEKFTYNAETDLFELKEGVDENTKLPQYIQAYNDASSFYTTYSKPNRKAIYDKDANVENGAKPIGYSESATLNVNQAQYEAAMDQYEKDLAEYEKILDQINAKTQEIHESDKKLELQLKQLDTEQEAIQTEYEAVKKVIDKNIENTFKSFA